MISTTRLKSLGLGAALLIAACSSGAQPIGGTGGATGTGGADAAVDTGPTPCAGMAISFTSNVPTNSNPAKSRVMVDFTTDTTDLPIGNSPRTIEFWAFVLTTSWRGDANTMFEYGQTSPPNGGYGLDFGGVAGTIDPYTNGSFDNDNQPTGITDFATNNQSIHFAMVYDQTAVTLYVNGNFMAGTVGSQRMPAGGGMLATVRTMLTIGGNRAAPTSTARSTNSACGTSRARRPTSWRPWARSSSATRMASSGTGSSTTAPAPRPRTR